MQVIIPLIFDCQNSHLFGIEAKFNDHYHKGSITSQNKSHGKNERVAHFDPKQNCSRVRENNSEFILFQAHCPIVIGFPKIQRDRTWLASAYPCDNLTDGWTVKFSQVGHAKLHIPMAQTQFGAQNFLANRQTNLRKYKVNTKRSISSIFEKEFNPLCLSEVTRMKDS